MFTPDGVDLCVKTCLYKKSPVILKLRGVIDRFLYFMEKKHSSAQRDSTEMCPPKGRQRQNQSDNACRFKKTDYIPDT